MKIGLYFGSFNPIHMGHLCVAQYILEHAAFHQIWFVVSPHNPFKEKDSLLPQDQRFQMVQAAIQDNPSFIASDVEFSMPQPSYTIHTLEALKQQHPEHQFSLIMGADNLIGLPNWHQVNKILEFPIHVYKRQCSQLESPVNGDFTYHQAPQIGISSTYIRQCISQGLSIRYLVPEAVHDFILANKFYL